MRRGPLGVAARGRLFGACEGKPSQMVVFFRHNGDCQFPTLITKITKIEIEISIINNQVLSHLHCNRTCFSIIPPSNLIEVAQLVRGQVG